MLTGAITSRSRTSTTEPPPRSSGIVTYLWLSVGPCLTVSSGQITLLVFAVRPTGGQVVALIHGAAQDRLVIERDGVKFELPFVQALVPVVDVDGGYIEIVEPEGLIESSV